MLKELRCPVCNAKISVPYDDIKVKCEYCDSLFEVELNEEQYLAMESKKNAALVKDYIEKYIKLQELIESFNQNEIRMNNLRGMLTSKKDFFEAQAFAVREPAVRKQLQKLFMENQELGDKISELKNGFDIGIIPPNYRTVTALNEIYYSLSSGKVSYISEAIKLYEEKEYQKQERELKLQQLEIQRQQLESDNNTALTERKNVNINIDPLSTAFSVGEMITGAVTAHKIIKKFLK